MVWIKRIAEKLAWFLLAFAVVEAGRALLGRWAAGIGMLSVFASYIWVQNHWGDLWGLVAEFREEFRVAILGLVGLPIWGFLVVEAVSSIYGLPVEGALLWFCFVTVACPFVCFLGFIYFAAIARKSDRLKGEEKHGLVTEWHENGQRAEEATYKDGKLHGLAIAWHENGQKKAETRFKDDDLDGLVREWHENGQKRSELMWKYDELISTKYWNSKGEEVETEEESAE